ncbi:MAG TPA: tryptophan-rich sensory protein [Blastocatellia bacterium]|nr:tryptophan-rich sensory protein [Blastocatellia bacterium]
MLNDKLRQSLNVCFAVAQPLVAALTQLEITGPSIGEISDRYPTYVAPAGYAFTIWSLIFALSLGYAVWQALPSERENPLLRRVGWLTASAMAATSAWMIVFQRSLFALSVAVMLWLLTSLVGVVARAHRSAATFSRVEAWLVYYAFSIFLGWITVATVANIAQPLTAFGWGGWGIDAQTWGVVPLLLAGVIASVATAAMRGNAPYALTVIWALIAVAVNQFSRATPANSTTVGAVAVGMALLVGTTLLVSRGRRARSVLRSGEPVTF